MSAYDSDFQNGLQPSDNEPSSGPEPVNDLEPMDEAKDERWLPPKTDADIVLVIDATGSMIPFLEHVKSEAIHFMPGLEAALAEKKRLVRQVRLKVILFRDFYHDDVPLIESPFFDMPGQQQEYADFLSKFEAIGGGDVPENSLEALALAIKSRWSSDPAVTRHRQVIALFTNAVPHPLDSPRREDPRLNQKYPGDLADIWTLDDLQMLWLNPQVISKSGKRLALFAPDAEPWTTIKTWNLVVPSAYLQTNMGGDEVNMDMVYNYIASAI